MKIEEYIKEKAKEQVELERKSFNYEFITKHAIRRLEERFIYWGIKEEDILQNLAKPLSRKFKKGIYTIYGKHWQYILSEQKVLITVI